MMDLNKEIAEKVMGWKDNWPQVKCFHTGIDINMPWNPLQDLNQCFEVVDKMDKEHSALLLLAFLDDDQGWEAVFEIYHPERKINKTSLYVGEAETPNAAILKAALEVVK